jgi:hypothetical protein
MFNKKIKFVCSLLAVILLAGCFGNGTTTKVDQFRNQKVTQTRKMLISHLFDSELEMQLQKVSSLDTPTDTDYQIRLFYKGKASQRPQFKKGESLVFLLNSKERVKVATETGSQGVKVVEKNYMFDNIEKENVVYQHITLDQLKNIAHSHTVLVKAEGENADVKGELSESHIMLLRNFIKEQA